ESRTVVHSHGYKPDVLLGALGIHRRLACFATCHSWYSATTKMKVFEYLDKRALRRFDHVAAVSDEIYRDLLASGAPAERVSRITNGISVPRIDAAARETIRSGWNLAHDEKLVVQIGRLTSSKCKPILL